MHAVYEFGAAKKKYKGRFLVVSDLPEAAKILEEDGRSTAWFGPLGPYHWPEMMLTPESCPNLAAIALANAKAYPYKAQLPIWIDCRNKRHPHVVAEKGRHGQRTYPFNLRAATKGSLVLMAATQADSAYYLWPSQLEQVGWANEYRRYQPLIAALHDLLEEDPPPEGGNVLYSLLEQRVPSLRGILGPPVELDLIFDPDNLMPGDSSRASWRKAPFYLATALESVREDYLHFSSNGSTPFSSAVRLLPAKGKLDPCLIFPKRRASVLPAKLAIRRVIVVEAQAERLRPLLCNLGMQEVCGAEILSQVAGGSDMPRIIKGHRRRAAALRWMLYAGKQLMKAGIPLEKVRQRQLAREAGVDPATVSRHWAAIQQGLADRQQREGPST